MGDGVSESANQRRTAILEAAQEVFLRYGFKKTSMDDVARAAGISRQGLYLHFTAKEALFRASLQHAVERMRTSARSELESTGGDTESRLLGAFIVMHGSLIGRAEASHVDELMATAREMLGDEAEEVERSFLADVSAALEREGVVANWRRLGADSGALARLLSATSMGLKHEVETPEAYRAQMELVIRLLVRGGARKV